MKIFFSLLIFSFFSFFIQKEKIWQTLSTTNEPTKRHECSVLALNGKVYLVGGRGIKKIYAFTPETKTWETLAETPLEMHHIQPVVFNNKIYVVGGLTGQYPLETPLTNIYIFDPKTNDWTKSIEIPTSRRRGGAGAAVYNNKIYLANGITLGHTSGTNAMFDVFNPINNTWDSLANAPHIKDHCAAVINNHKLYVVGGRNTSYHEPDNFLAFFKTTEGIVDYFNFKTNKWNTLSENLPVPTAVGGVVSYNDNIIYFGGESSQEKAHNETQNYNTKTKKWTQLAPMQTGRHGTGSALINGFIYTAGGCSLRGGSPELSSIEAYNLK
jgi:N-acetylneuraminic acid mutarotase